MDWKIGSRDSRYQFMDTLLYFRTYTRSGTFGIGMEIVPRILLLSYTESIKISHPTLVYEPRISLYSKFHRLLERKNERQRTMTSDDRWWLEILIDALDRKVYMWIYKMCLDARIHIYIFWIYSSTSTRFGEKSLPRRIRVFIFRSLGLLNNLSLDSKYKIYFECYRNF